MRTVSVLRHRLIPSLLQVMILLGLKGVSTSPFLVHIKRLCSILVLHPFHAYLPIYGLHSDRDTYTETHMNPGSCTWAEGTAPGVGVSSAAHDPIRSPERHASQARGHLYKVEVYITAAV